MTAQTPDPEPTAEPGHPRLLANTGDHSGGGDDGTDPGHESGAVWRLEPPERDLDANVIALPPGGSIDRHTGPALDVLLHVVAGAGELVTEHGTIALVPGALVWLPRGSRREFRAGDGGLRYLTVHQRRHDALAITRRPPSSAESGHETGPRA